AVTTSPWSVIISKRWLKPEHINALEMRSVLLALHWVLSHRSSVSSRVLLLIDSLVSHGVLWKGRCSSIPLLFIARKLSALLLASGIVLSPAWIPSALNPADAPSRERLDPHRAA
ncbi:MAG: hypothetical protein P4M11_15830, partial [Candidatus Pacebacteria bacterium]|nr:hypothetical protein [Candidatus Paceibacterota bacterium]